MLLERDDVHLKPFGYEYDDNGEMWTKCYVYRGSHEYDTKEMASLIDGAIREAKDLGIETLSAAELQRLVENWKA